MVLVPPVKFNLPSSVLRRWRRQKTRVIVLVGTRKVGKDVFLKYVLRRYRGIAHYRIAEAPVRIAKLLELLPERRVLHALFGVNALLYPLLHESAYKRRVAKLLDKEKPRRAIVEAVRTKEEYKEFVVKRRGILVGITADDRVRYGRALFDAKESREKQDEGKMTFKQFMDREKSKIEREIAWITRNAHAVIDNSQDGKAHFYESIDKIMVKLGLKKLKNH